MRGSCIALMIAIAGCGRSGFDPSGSTDSNGDAVGGDVTFVPSNQVPSALLDEVTGVLDDASGSITINTDTGEITGSVTVRAAGAGMIDGIRFETSATLGMFGMSRWTVAASTNVRVLGSRAIAVLVREDVMIAGAINVSAGLCVGGPDPTCGGPGGGLGSRSSVLVATGCGPGGSGTGSNEPGGGGGGMGQAGADGGATPPGQGGSIAACPSAALVPLVGGGGGGHGGGLVGGGGGGGGAIQISSYLKIRINGLGIVASGEGGRGGGGEGAGGGGAGGAILLEAPIVDLISGTLAANGGGGGEGNGDVPGATGRFDAMPAAGGIASGGLAPGGDGGARDTPPTAGIVDSTLADAGGGGGGAGRIRLNASTLNRMPVFVTSPADTTGAL